MLSKRKIIPLVESGELSGFDDPRLYTIRGLRRRGFTPAMLKELAGLSSVDRKDTVLSTEIVLHTLRSSLATAPKGFAVIRPLCVHVSNGGRDLYIERSDFREEDSPDYYRMAPGKTVRLRYDKFITYAGHTPECLTVTESATASAKVKGIIHWVDAATARPAVFHIYDEMVHTAHRGWVNGEMELTVGGTYQFERLGYFRYDRDEEGVPHFIRTVALVNKYD